MHNARRFRTTSYQKLQRGRPCCIIWTIFIRLLHAFRSISVVFCMDRIYSFETISCTATFTAKVPSPVANTPAEISHGIFLFNSCRCLGITISITCKSTINVTLSITPSTKRSHTESIENIRNVLHTSWICSRCNFLDVEIKQRAEVIRSGLYDSNDAVKLDVFFVSIWGNLLRRVCELELATLCALFVEFFVDFTGSIPVVSSSTRERTCDKSSRSCVRNSGD
mmetsp:Transcript_7801/g.14168  ORF Transcript_7801/g.14168 Transcript_7801/m.14168 type:complete len:224 (-) Transcript_7801:374-1045(-)